MKDKPEVLCNTMRHVATVTAIASRNLDNATVGYNLAAGVEDLIAYNFTAAELKEHLQTLIDEYKGERANNTARFKARGAAIDATVFADNS